jgi:hypothetical protein
MDAIVSPAIGTAPIGLVARRGGVVQTRAPRRFDSPVRIAKNGDTVRAREQTAARKFMGISARAIFLGNFATEAATKLGTDIMRFLWRLNRRGYCHLLSPDCDIRNQLPT